MALRRVVCVKGLFKSTYKRNAFLKNRHYNVVRVEDDMVWVRDEMDHEFNFAPSGTDPGTCYAFDDYFRYVKD